MVIEEKERQEWELDFFIISLKTDIKNDKRKKKN